MAARRGKANGWQVGRKSKKETQTATRPSDEQISQEIQAEAYSRFMNRGGQDGNDLCDWLEAEEQIKKKYQLQ